jgi:hypothetical protein
VSLRARAALPSLLLACPALLRSIVHLNPSPLHLPSSHLHLPGVEAANRPSRPHIYIDGPSHYTRRVVDCLSHRHITTESAISPSSTPPLCHVSSRLTSRSKKKSKSGELCSPRGNHDAKRPVFESHHPTCFRPSFTCLSLLNRSGRAELCCRTKPSRVLANWSVRSVSLLRLLVTGPGVLAVLSIAALKGSEARGVHARQAASG